MSQTGLYLGEAFVGPDLGAQTSVPEGALALPPRENLQSIPRATRVLYNWMEMDGQLDGFMRYRIGWKWMDKWMTL